MSNTYSSNLKLAMPAVGDTGWSVPINGNAQALDALAPVGGLAVTTNEVPSESLAIAIAPGAWRNEANVVTAQAGAVAQIVPPLATSYVYLTGAGSLSITTAGWPAPGTPYVPLATVVTGASTITSITDQRTALAVAGAAYLPTAGGALADGANVAIGTATGTQIGTASNQKLGFFGKTPAEQPTMGAAIAGSSYTSSEQAMLQAVYNAVRALGLGS